MRRIAVIRAFAVAVVAVMPFVHAVDAAGRATGEPIPRPDIVLVLTDDQRWDTIDAMPTLQREVAGHGVEFENAFVVNALCCPSRASILTGLYSHSTGVYRQAPPFGRFESFDDSVTVATMLQAAGYRTGFFGKYIDGGQSEILTGYVPPGWDTWVSFAHAGYLDYRLSIDGEIVDHGSAPEDYSTGVLSRMAIDFLNASDGPAFVVLAPAAPHAPALPEGAHADAPVPAWERPPSFDEADVSDKPAWLQDLPPLSDGDIEYLERFRADQYRSLLSVDDALGEVLETQRLRGRLPDTLLIYTSDNGLAWGEHRWSKKEVPYEESIRVPMLIRYDRVATHAVDDRLALNIDLTPTIVDAAGATDALGFEGRSLLPLLTGDETAAWRTDFLVEHLEGSNPVPTYCAVRTEHAVSIEYRSGEVEYYDLVRDPFQLRNTASTATGLAALHERLLELCDPPPPDVPPLHRGASPVVRVGLVAVPALIAVLVLALAMRQERRKRVASPD